MPPPGPRWRRPDIAWMSTASSAPPASLTQVVLLLIADPRGNRYPAASILRNDAGVHGGGARLPGLHAEGEGDGHERG
jgi:hypothetical protein